MGGANAEKRRMLERKIAEVRLRLERERSKPYPNTGKIERYEREEEVWRQQIKKLE